MTVDLWTLCFQVVNVAILVWLLQHFFWRPVSAMIVQRRTTTEQALAQAKATQDKATAALADITKTRAGFAKERDDLLAAAHSEADKARAATLDDASKQAASLGAAAQASIKKDRVDAEASWSDHASQLAVDIAGRLAERLKGPAVSTIFLDWLVSGIKALPDSTRQAAAADGIALEAVSADPLTSAEQDRYRTEIAKAFGASPQVTFKADPTLIAGIELHGPHFTVKNSWRADLSHILKDITHARSQ